MKKKVVIYMRVSTDEQADRGYSLRDQEDRLRKYCAMKSYEIINAYTEDFSAKTFERPAFKMMFKYCKKQKSEIDQLLFVKGDRFSRNASESHQMINKFDKMGIVVNSIEQPVDLSIPEQKLMLAFYLASPEVENDRRSLNTRHGMRRAMKEGRYVYRPPLGYVYIRDASNKPRLTPNEGAEYVKRAFEMYAVKGETMEGVRKKLNTEMRYTCSANNFNKLIKNIVYAGMIRIPAWKEEKETVVKGIHEPIISMELFEKCQAKNLGKSKGVKSIRGPEFPLRGHLVCSICERVMTGSTSRGNGGKFSYYHCRSGCKGRIQTSKAHGLFEELLDSIGIDKSYERLYLRIRNSYFKQVVEISKKGQGQIKKKITEIKTKIDNAVDKYINGKLTEGIYENFIQKQTERLKILEKELDSIENLDQSEGKYLGESLTLLSSLKAYYNVATVDLKYRLLGLIFPEKIILDNDEVRTNKLNELFIDISLIINEIGSNKKEEGLIFSSASSMAARRGFEPLLPG